MAGLEDYQKQGFRNLDFLLKINKELTEFYDWQVTVSFYTALHFMNFHLCSHLPAENFNRHDKVEQLISPHSAVTSLRLDDESFSAYKALRNESRKSRYLYNESDEAKAPYIGVKQLCRSIRYLDRILWFINTKYGVRFAQKKIMCEKLNKYSLQYFSES